MATQVANTNTREYGTPLSSVFGGDAKDTGWYVLADLSIGTTFRVAAGKSGGGDLLIIHDGAIYLDSLLFRGQIVYRHRWETTAPAWQE